MQIGPCSAQLVTPDFELVQHFVFLGFLLLSALSPVINAIWNAHFHLRPGLSTASKNY